MSQVLVVAELHDGVAEVAGLELSGLRDHVAHCVEHAIVSGSRAEQRQKIAELMDVVSRADR